MTHIAHNDDQSNSTIYITQGPNSAIDREMGDCSRRAGRRLGCQAHEDQVGFSSVEARRIWLNLELAKKPVQCLEYIVVHEMVHLIERHRNDRFVELMDAFMTSWRLYRDELNHTPLGHETWVY
jgi:predicted metal-dependent hydrolase